MSNEFQVIYKLLQNEALPIATQMRIDYPKIVDIMESDGLNLKIPKDLRYFKTPKLTSYPLDLNKGFAQYVFRHDDIHLSNSNRIERYLMKSEFCNEASDMEKICVQRAVLHRIMITPYIQNPEAKFNDWTIYATRCKSITYLVNSETSQEYTKSANESYHFKFEQYCFADACHAVPNTDVPVDENQQIFCVFRTLLQNFDILYSSEIIGVLADSKIGNLTDMAELNKCRFVLTKLFPEATMRHWQTSPKILKLLLQAYLVNVKDFYVGFKNRNGYIKKPIQHATINELFQANPRWKLSCCIRFLHKILTLIQQKMSNVDCPFTVYAFAYDSVHRCIKYKIYPANDSPSGRTNYSFLSEPFVEHLQKQRI